MIEIVQYDDWINDKGYATVGYVKASECNYDKSKFKEELEKGIGENINLLTDIKEQYYRCVKSDDIDYGEYIYKPCEKSRGASLYYYAGFEEIEKE